MTKNFERYIYPLLHTSHSDYFEGTRTVGDDLEDAWRMLGIKYNENICRSCENKIDCCFRARGDNGYASCNFYEKKEES